MSVRKTYYRLRFSHESVMKRGAPSEKKRKRLRMEFSAFSFRFNVFISDICASLHYLVCLDVPTENSNDRQFCGSGVYLPQILSYEESNSFVFGEMKMSLWVIKKKAS